MNAAQLLEYFDRISEAPDAVPRLRRFILDLAVRGKLIEQDPRDEPATELLKGIQEEKSELLKDGTIKKIDSIALPPDSAFPFPLPSGWARSTLQSLCISVTDGDHLPPPKADRGIPFLVIGNVRSQTLDFVGCRHVSEQYYNNLDAIRRPRTNDVLYTLVGSYGIPITITDNREFCVQRHIGILRPSRRMSAPFLGRVLESKWVFDQATACATGIAQKTVPLSGLRKFLIPLPPFAEQQRIIAKVNELMTLCSRLEAARNERESRRDRLAAASHHHLNNGANGEAYRSHANFYINHLPIITFRPEQIPALRRAVLSMAVRGELVRQDPSDEPASLLLRRIEAEKLRLVKEGKINREKPPIPARPDDLGFELMPGWGAARISQLLVELQTGPFGSSLHESDYERGGVPVINPASIKNGRLIPIDSMAVGPATLKRLASFKLRTNDIVMARRGEMGRCGVVTEREAGWLCGTGSLMLRLPNCLFPSFFVTLIGSPFVREYLGGSAVGATMQNLNQSILLNLVVGLPPLAEQLRIVAKVNELMAVCDRLEAQLTAVQAENSLLLEAVLHHALHSSDQLREAVER